ncbi:dipeptidyl peptidase CTSC [Acrasis kona]|uniref:Dipeptidyl peptidase 1 n=1 Tax=Acrasis kona TaxID=1008807 RepID=A0AAW2Z396_9EUKA
MNLVVLLLVSILTVANADLPVHCLHENIVGEWKLFKSRLVERDYPLDCKKDVGNTEIEETIVLKSPNIVYNKNNRRIGFWTMIYDQGFEFTIKEQLHFAFNNFTQQRTGENEMITSYCGQTSFGWYRILDDNKHGCYYAHKINVKKNDTIVSPPVNSMLYLEKGEYEKLNTHKNNHKLVRSINEEEDWSAEAYDNLEKMTISKIKAISGQSIDTKTQQQLLESENRVMEDSAADRILRKQLPKQWDWRNVSGINYVGPVRDQESCGSCYAFAATSAIESRVRILTNNRLKSILSPQQVVSCSDYNQKCSGGFPIMVGKHGYDFYLVPEECYEYQGQPGDCKLACKNPKYKVKVTQYSYIGGYYGANNELNMMREVVERGPISINYMVYPSFHYYKHGVYRHNHKQSRFFNIKTAHNGVKHWEATTHAVAVVGYGETDEGVRYWICKNSWGDWWGEGGYFKILRGVDECASEMQASSAQIEIIEM